MIKRNIYLDQMRGIAALLVIFGHCFQTAYISYPSLIIYQFIYLFHVPLFAMVSGYLLAEKENMPFFTFAYSRVKRLFIPYIIWMTVIAWVYNDALLINNPFQFYLRGITTIQTPWFLYVLFISSLIFFLITRVKSKIIIFCIAIGMLMLNMYSRQKTLDVSAVFVVKTIYYIFIVALGYYFQTFNIKQSHLKLIFVPAIIFLFLFLSLDLSLRKNPYLFPLELINTLLGIYVVFFIVYKARDYFSSAGITWLGMHALEIYVIHYLFLILIPYAHNNFLLFVISFISVSALSIMVIKLKEIIIYLYPWTKSTLIIIFGSYKN